MDTRATGLSLPTPLNRQLGLARVSSETEPGFYEPVRLSILGRTCTMDVREVPSDRPATIGQSILTHLDLVVDSQNRSLIGNPEHGGEQVYELY